MQQLADQDVQADRGDIRPSRKRRASARRKVTVRLREGGPLMQETIDRLNSAQDEESNPTTGERPTHNSTPALKESSAAPERLNLEQTPPASAKAERRSPGVSQHEKNTGDRTEPTLDRGLTPPAAQNSD